MCWKKQHDVQPNLGHHGSALPSLKPFKFSSTAGAACQQLLGGDNDRSYMRQPVLAVKSMLVQHANRGVGKKTWKLFPEKSEGQNTLGISWGQEVLEACNSQNSKSCEMSEPCCIMLGVGYFWADSQPVGRNVRLVTQPYTRKLTQPYTRNLTRLYTRNQLSHTRELSSAIHAKCISAIHATRQCFGHSFDEHMFAVCYNYNMSRWLSACMFGARELSFMCAQMSC